MSAVTRQFAWTYRAGHGLHLEDRPIPRPRPGEAVLRVRACGICGTDLHILRGRLPGITAPEIVLGHEIMGEIAAVGRGVKGLCEGDRCTIDPLVACGQCAACRDGHSQHCARGREIGFQIDGGWQQFLVAPARNFHRLPSSIDDLSGSQIETAHGPAGGVEKLHVRRGETALVIGCGPAGLNFVQLLALRGARVTAVDPSQAKLGIARRLGARGTVGAGFRPRSSGDRGPKPPPTPAWGPRTFDIVVEAAGTRTTTSQALAAAARGGRVLLFGLSGERAQPVDVTDLILKNLSVVSVTNSPHIWRGLIRQVARRDVRLRPLVTAVYPLDRLKDGIAHAERDPARTVRVVVTG